VATGDVNDDGRLDIATVHYSGNVNNTADDAVVILLGESRGGFRRAPGSPFRTGRAPVAIAMGDVNGDGLADVATANLGTNDATLLLGGRESIAPAAGSPFKSGESPEAVALGDIDGDSKADLFVANSAGNDLTVYLTRQR